MVFCRLCAGNEMFLAMLPYMVTATTLFKDSLQQKTSLKWCFWFYWSSSLSWIWIFIILTLTLISKSLWISVGFFQKKITSKLVLKKTITFKKFKYFKNSNVWFLVCVQLNNSTLEALFWVTCCRCKATLWCQPRSSSPLPPCGRSRSSCCCRRCVWCWTWRDPSSPARTPSWSTRWKTVNWWDLQILSLPPPCCLSADRAVNLALAAVAERIQSN